jgi:hypothetical protein
MMVFVTVQKVLMIEQQYFLRGKLLTLCSVYVLTFEPFERLEY